MGKRLLFINYISQERISSEFTSEIQLEFLINYRKYAVASNKNFPNTFFTYSVNIKHHLTNYCTSNRAYPSWPLSTTDHVQVPKIVCPQVFTPKYMTTQPRPKIIHINLSSLEKFPTINRFRKAALTAHCCPLILKHPRRKYLRGKKSPVAPIRCSNRYSTRFPWRVIPWPACLPDCCRVSVGAVGFGLFTWDPARKKKAAEGKPRFAASSTGIARDVYIENNMKIDKI